MSQEKIVQSAQNNTNELKKSVVFQAARAAIIAMIKKQIQDAALQSKIIADFADELAELLAQSSQQAWEQLAQDKLAEWLQNHKGQTTALEAFLPEQLNSTNPIVAKAVVDIHQQIQRFNTLQANFAPVQTVAVNAVAQIHNVVAAKMAPSAPKPAVREDYIKEVALALGYAKEVNAYLSMVDNHMDKVLDCSSKIGANLKLIPENHKDAAHLKSKEEEIHSYIAKFQQSKAQMANTLTIIYGYHTGLQTHYESTYGEKMPADFAGLSANYFLLFKAANFSSSSSPIAGDDNSLLSLHMLR